MAYLNIEQHSSRLKELVFHQQYYSWMHLGLKSGLLGSGTSVTLLWLTIKSHGQNIIFEICWILLCLVTQRSPCISIQHAYTVWEEEEDGQIQIIIVNETLR